MQRLLTTVTCAAWLGYCAVAAFRHGAAMLVAAREGLDTRSMPSALSSFATHEAVATGFLAIAGLFGAALFLVHVRQGRRAVVAAERLSLAALAASGLMLWFGAGPVGGPPMTTATLVLVLMASALALALDRLIAVDEEEDSNLESFEAGIAAVAEAMARQTRLYTPQHDEPARR
jgi:hypothetical protein